MTEDLAFAVERTFLAHEFLTWLWFKCEVEGGNFELADGPVGIAIDDGLTLSSWEDDGMKATLRGGSPTGRPEAANALAAGLLLKRCKMIAARGSREWQFSLDGDSLDLLSVKVVDADEDDDPEDALADKLAAGEQLRDVVDGLYREFLVLRLSKQWKRTEVKRLRDWVRDKLGQAAVTVGAA